MRINSKLLRTVQIEANRHLHELKMFHLEQKGYTYPVLYNSNSYLYDVKRKMRENEEDVEENNRK